MRLHPLSVIAAFAVLAVASPTRANVMIIIDKSAQKMTVTVNGEDRYVWPVSTGRSGYDTPGGDFQPFRMEKDHFSREWDDAPMPHSIFFSQIGHAIHGTYETRNLGRPASHGCVRLSTQNAATLFALVSRKAYSIRTCGSSARSRTPNLPTTRSRAVTIAIVIRACSTMATWRPSVAASAAGTTIHTITQPYYEQRRYYGGRGFFPFGW